MAEKKVNRGGARVGAGRKKGNRRIAITVKISEEAKDILNTIENKSEFIDALVRDADIPR